MIILNRTQIRNVILRYDALYNGMVAQREEQEAYIEESKGYWLGKSGEAYRKAHCKLIREGAYAKYLEAVKEIRDIFDESMPHLNELQNMCAEMPNQLGQCGITGGPTEVLMVNENYLDTFNDQVEETLRLNQLTHDVMESIMDGCEGLCDVGITRRLNEEAYEQQSRLRNLLDYINLYAVKLKKLDCELSDRYRGILHKIVEQPAVGTTESTNDYAWDTIRRILVEERGWSETEADAALYYLQYNNPTGLSQLELYHQNRIYPAYDSELDYLLSECDKLRTREEFVQWLLNGEEQLQINAGLRNLVSTAYGQIGLLDRLSENSNQYTEWYYGHSQAAPWCAIFVTWCSKEAGLFLDDFLDLDRDSFVNSGLAVVSNYAALYYVNGQYHSRNGTKDVFIRNSSSITGIDTKDINVEPEPDYIPKVGDFICFAYDGGGTHIGIVTGYDTENQIVYTIEGNTSDVENEDIIRAKSYHYDNSTIQGYCSNGGTEISMNNVVL